MKAPREQDIAFPVDINMSNEKGLARKMGEIPRSRSNTGNGKEHRRCTMPRTAV